MPALKRYLLFTCCTVFLLGACRQRSKSLSFYYWRTSFHTDSVETAALRSNHVSTLYTRYFDIDFLPGDTAPSPVSPIIWDSSALQLQLVPVVYIKNRVFEHLTPYEVIQLCNNVHRLVNGISAIKKINPAEIQFDCDWTENTQPAFFHFLQQYRSLSKQRISCTIRLHQVKYPQQTGIPPVDKGILMYYNMGNIDAGSLNSIYDKSIAASYIPALGNYPLPLDIALPIFAWAQQVRNGKIIKLLNKMNFQHFENDSNFTPLPQHRYSVKHACFHGGYYFSEHDEIKTEQVSARQLMEIVEQVNQHSNHRIGNLIFFDLDKENLVLYDQTVFRKVLDKLD